MQRTFPERKNWVDYQARIGGMPNGLAFIVEWEFNGREFDGFVSAESLLKEAKGGYDRFFDEWGRPKKWWAYQVELGCNAKAAHSIGMILAGTAYLRQFSPKLTEWFLGGDTKEEAFLYPAFDERGYNGDCSRTASEISQKEVKHHFSPN
jgi:hypothetical protein